MCSMPLEELVNSISASTPATPAVTPPPDSNSSTTPAPNQVLSSLTYPNGTKPKSVVWSCRKGSERCCGTDCCPSSESSSSSNGSSIGTIIFMYVAGYFATSYPGVCLRVILLMLLMCCCCCFLAYKFCRSAFDNFLPSRNTNYQDDRNKYGNEYSPNPQQQYGEGAGSCLSVHSSRSRNYGATI